MQGELAAAQAAVAKPTRAEARAQRFEAPGPSGWKGKSMAVARQEAEARHARLADAQHAAAQLVSRGVRAGNVLRDGSGQLRGGGGPSRAVHCCS